MNPDHFEQNGVVYDHAGSDVWIKENQETGERTIAYSDQVVDELKVDPKEVPGTAEHEGDRRDRAAYGDRDDD